MLRAGVGGPIRLPAGTGGGCPLPDTGVFLLFPSRVCPAVSDQSGEGSCPTPGGSLSCHKVRSGGLGAAAAASHVPATASPSQGSCLCHPGGRLARSWSVWANSTTLLRPQASQRARQVLKGAAPASGPNAAGRHSLSTVLWRREWHLCPPSLWSWITILGLALLQQDGHFLGVRAHARSLSTALGGWGLVLTVCPAAVHCPQPPLVLSVLTISLWPWRPGVPLPGALPHALPWEAAALGSGSAGLAGSP